MYVSMNMCVLEYAYLNVFKNKKYISSVFDARRLTFLFFSSDLSVGSRQELARVTTPQTGFLQGFLTWRMWPLLYQRISALPP